MPLAGRRGLAAAGLAHGRGPRHWAWSDAHVVVYARSCRTTCVRALLDVYNGLSMLHAVVRSWPCRHTYMQYILMTTGCAHGCVCMYVCVWAMRFYFPNTHMHHCTGPYCAALLSWHSPTPCPHAFLSVLEYNSCVLRYLHHQELLFAAIEQPRGMHARASPGSPGGAPLAARSVRILSVENCAVFRMRRAM